MGLERLKTRIRGLIVGAVITLWAVVVRITTGRWPDTIEVGK